MGSLLFAWSWGVRRWSDIFANVFRGLRERFGDYFALTGVFVSVSGLFYFNNYTATLDGNCFGLSGNFGKVFR